MSTSFAARFAIAIAGISVIGSVPILATPAAANATHARSSRIVCGSVAAGYARCFAHEVDDSRPNAYGSPSGYNPPDLQSAYALPSSSAGSGQTVAIVDAFDDPKAEADLGVYRSQFGLAACTTANGCFKKVNQSGGHKYPSPDAGWAEEISLDLDMVSA